MSHPIRIAFFGSSLVSAYWNGAATYYRGLLRALAGRGHEITFFEPDAFERQQHRDMADPPWARVHVYSAQSEAEVLATVREARDADLVVKASGVGVYDELLEAAVLDIQKPDTLVAFWDVDAPATLDRVHNDAGDPFRELIPQYDLVFTYGGGDPVVQAYESLGARRCVPIYNALDPETHFRVKAASRFDADLAFLGNRMPDRETRVNEFFLSAARMMPSHRFLLGGNGWEQDKLAANVRAIGHVYTADHNAFNCSPTAVLNINRGSMARYGFSPPTRIFEAAGAGACLITDAWEGIELFLDPGTEVLIASDGADVAEYVRWLDRTTAGQVGSAARQRVLEQHTYQHRAAEVEFALEGAHATTGPGNNAVRS